MDVSRVKEYLLKPGFLDRTRKLVLTEKYLDWENRDLKGKEFSRINKFDYADFKHGMDWIVWYKFTVGRDYSITFKDTTNKELRIRFRSYFGLNNENHQKYCEIINDVWILYHSNVVNNLLDKFYNIGQVDVQGLKLKSEGIELRERMGLIPWAKVATKDYYRYFAIFHQGDPAMHSRVSYNEFGTETLWSMIRIILKEKEMNSSRHDA